MDASGQDDGLAQDLQITPENSDVDESGTSFTISICQSYLWDDFGKLSLYQHTLVPGIE